MSLVVLVFIAVAFLIGSSAAMDNPGRVDSSRASIFRVDSQLFTSAAVRAGAQFVSLLVARYSKSVFNKLSYSVFLPLGLLAGTSGNGCRSSSAPSSSRRARAYASRLSHRSSTSPWLPRSELMTPF